MNISSLLAAARPVPPGHGGSLSFAGPNESNQSKGPNTIRAGSLRQEGSAGDARFCLSALRVRHEEQMHWLFVPDASLVPDRSAIRQPNFLAEASRSDRVQALCFGDFHLGQQMKVTGGAGPGPGAAASRSDDPVVGNATWPSSCSTSSDLHAGYGSAEVLHGLTITARAGKVITVIGPNGAGKSTLLNALMGVLPSRGTLEYDGAPIGLHSLEERVMLGMALVPETRALFGDHVGRGQPAARRATGRSASARRTAPSRSTRSSRCSRACASGAPSSPARSRAASGRCSRSAAP